MGRRVEVVPWKEKWIEMYRREAKRLQAIFGRQLVRIHHIGSTAIPGMSTKPIIDILIEVVDIGHVDRLNGQMEQLGYEPRGENGIPGRRFFTKGGDNRTHHVHVFQEADPHVERHLAFRDYLIAHAEEAERYKQLKAQLAVRFPLDIESYIAGKDALVKELEQKALAWTKQLDTRP